MEETIDLKNIFKMMWEKKSIIIIVTMIAILLGFIYSYKFVKPKYTAKVQIVLVQIDKNQEKKANIGALTQADVTINDKIISTYQKLLTNDDVLTQVIKNTQIDEDIFSNRSCWLYRCQLHKILTKQKVSESRYKGIDTR